MDSWTLQGDSYSFLRSAPRTFSLCHREGTPNHVEIFDIINVPTQRSAISETTCLCDIFGDDRESPSLSSGRAVGTFVPSQREVDGTAAASPTAEDLNDSSGSYHTAQGSSEGEEGFEDSRERLCSPLFQNVSSERKLSESEGLSTRHPDISKDTSNDSEPKSRSPVPEINSSSPLSEVLNSDERTPSPGYNSPNTFSSEERVSSLSSSSVEKRFSPSSPYTRQVDSKTQSREITPPFKDNSPSHQSLTPSASSESRNCVSSSIPHSVKSSPDFMGAQVFPEPRNYINQHDSPSSEATSNNLSTDFTEPAFDSTAFLPSPVPSPTCAELLSQSRETLVSPELRNRPESPSSQRSSSFPELRGRVSLPDLFSRGFTPDLEDSPCTPELISAPPTEEKDTSTTPENTPLLAQPVSTVSTPASRYTPPSPAISIATSAELMENSVSPIFRHKTPSPGLFSAASPCTTGTRTPSPKIKHISIPSEIRTLVPSPVTSYSLPPSPNDRSSFSPNRCRYTAPSPEIRVTGSSPEVSRRVQTSEVERTSTSPLLQTHFDSFSSRSPTSSPQITGISYTVVQPEDRDTPPFPELSHLCTPEPKRTHEGRSPTPIRDSIQGSIAESAGASQNSLHVSDCINCDQLCKIALSHPPGYQTPLPQQKHHTPSSESIHNTPLAKTYQSLSPQDRSEDLSPVGPSPGQRYYQHSQTTLSTEYNLQYTQPISPLRNTETEIDICAVDIADIQHTNNLAKNNVSESFETDGGDKSSVAEIKVSSPVQVIQSPVCSSPFIAEAKADTSLKRQSPERETTPTQNQSKSCLSSFSDEKQDTGPTFFQKDMYKKSPFDAKSIGASPVNMTVSSSPVQVLENIQPYSVSSESSSSCTPKHPRRQLSIKSRSENRDRFTDNIAHYVNKRRTPSPPLTRFTPVHIIAPEKPYRSWQNRSHSSSQVVAFSPSGNLKKTMTNRENPSASVDSNSHDHWVRLERQLEMEQEMQLEDEREVRRERQRDRERKKEEQIPEKGEGWQGNTSYRGEQVELSFNARNRKGPASCSTAPTSRETHQGLPTVHSYSESLPATRQLQQQQRLLRIASQQDTRVGGPSRRLKPSASQNKNSAPGTVAASRPCRSSSSSMGSELDEADNEVKWFTDVAFRSLSSPEVDYLDMYNSSHRSSTNISQSSTQESPAGVTASWLAYADLRGSAAKLDSDDLSFQQPTAHYSDGLDPSRRYEMGSFECVDVAVEREDFRKVRRGVPKRQIQLKRKNANTDGKQDERSENSSPGAPVMLECPSLESRSREKFTRQHSTPATMQECYASGESPEAIQQNEKKSKLKKSVSLDETGPKTKMATCLIKSVLSKKMQSVDKQTDEQTVEEARQTFEQNISTESAKEPRKESSKSEMYHLSTDLLPLTGETKTIDEAKPRKSFGVKSSSRPSSSSSCKSVNFSQTDSEEADSQNRNATSLRSDVRSEFKVPFDIKKSRTEVQQADDHNIWNEREGGDSANASPCNTEVPSATGARQQITNRDQQFENTEDHRQQRACTPKTQEGVFKTMEKKKSSLNVCLTPEAENKPEESSSNMSFTEKEEMPEISVEENTEEEEEGNGNSKAKVPIHKVRDVRRIVKNTYNLSFKASTAVLSSDANEEKIESFNEEKIEEIKKERREEIMKGEEKDLSQEKWQEEREEKTKYKEQRVEKKEEQKIVNDLTSSPPIQSKGKSPSLPQSMQIEYKAVCWKENKNKMSCSKKSSEDQSDKSQASPKLVTELSRESLKPSNANTQNYTTLDTGFAKSCQHDLNMAPGTQETVTEIHKTQDTGDKSVLVRTERKPPMLGSIPRVPSKEREVSTAVVIIRDASSKTKTSSSLVQEEVTTPLQTAAVSSSSSSSSLSSGPNVPGSSLGSSGHSVSMLLKEKGYQADIGAVMGDSQNEAGRKGLPHKHVNCLEIPLQTTAPADAGQIDSHRERTFSSSSNVSGPSVVSNCTGTLTKTREEEGIRSTAKDTAKQKSASPLRNIHEQTPPIAKQKELGDFEAVKRLDPTFPPRSPAIRRFRSQPIEVKSLSKETQKEEMPSTENNRLQAIEVQSIKKNLQKPTVPPKPICKFKPADVGVVSNEGQRPTAAVTVRPQDEERSQTIVVSSPTIYRKISNESMSTSNYTRKLAVSAVSSLKPPSSKTTATTFSSLSNQSTGLSEAEAAISKGEQQPVAASPQSSKNPQRLPTLATATSSVTDPGTKINSDPAPVYDPTVNQVAEPPSLATGNQPSQSAVMDPDNQPQYTRTVYPQERAMPATSNNTQQPATVSTTQMPGYTHQSSCRSLSSEHPQRSDDLRFYTSDDPPSYDERESFSPLILPDLTPRRSNRYQPSSRPPPCSCTTACPSHPGATPPHHHRSPHDLTPPAPSHSPGQALPYPVGQPPLRPHHCRPDHQPMSYQLGSPKSSPLGPSHPPALYQSLHQPPPCPPHPSLIQACPADRPLQPQHIDPRRPPVHRSPQQQPPVMAGTHYSDPGHSHSPGLPPMDPQYLCGPPSLGPSYGSEYGADSSSLYTESSYGQTPRRVLMDPETGKYFYIEMPAQPLRKMLFDPETGQYVEVLIPQQAMSHSGLYPPAAAPYPSLHNPSMYASAPQYMPYAAPPPPAHPQAQPQPPRYPEAPAAGTMHSSGPGINYRNPSCQGSKPEPQNHPSLDQSYLESMYYVPTGMNASPNPTPPDYYHKRPPNLPPTGGKRS